VTPANVNGGLEGEVREGEFVPSRHAGDDERAVEHRHGAILPSREPGHVERAVIDAAGPLERPHLPYLPQLTFAGAAAADESRTFVGRLRSTTESAAADGTGT
jgi:hypothetical protein